MSASILEPVISAPQFSDAAAEILEARADPRVGVDFPVEVFGSGFSGGRPASARDLSVSGVCVESSLGFNFKSIRQVRLDLASGPIELKAEGRWQSKSTSDDSVLTGVSFVDRNRDDVRRLWSAVHDANKELSLFLFDGSDLSELCADDATNLAVCSRYRLVSARRRIYLQDECRSGDDSIFVVLQGEVSLRVRFGGRPEVALERLTPGSLFGGLPAVADSPNPESAVADSQATLLEISRASFAYMRIAKPLLAQRVAQVVTRCLLQRSRKLLELASSSD